MLAKFKHKGTPTATKPKKITASIKINIEEASDASTLIASEVVESDNYRDIS